MKSAVVIFPGSNCDRDLAVAFRSVTGSAPIMVWHGDSELPAGLDVIGVPGGFSFGDYLRSGAMAARSPIMRAVIAAAEQGRSVLGICNGFQILTEAGLLPGALVRNAGIRFVCRDVALTVANNTTRFTSGYRADERIVLPVAHHDGNYVADAATLAALRGDGRVVLRYAEAVNGSADAIAGIVNQRGNVLGLMPHPERVIDSGHGRDDGRRLFQNLLQDVVAAV